MTEEKLADLTEITGDEVKAKEVIEASKSSMGQVSDASTVVGSGRDHQ